MALGLRIWHIAEGLPDFTDEAFPFRRAFRMAGWETGRLDWNPHAFHYPSLSFYLHLAVQWLHYGVGSLLGDYARPADFGIAFHVDPTPMVLVGRLVGVAAQVAILLGVFRVGERLRPGAGVLAALLLAVSVTFVRDARGIYTDAPMTALSVWALERMLAYREAGGGARLWTSAILIGLAAGTKYPGALLVIPLAWAVLAREGARALPRWLAACAVALLVFLLTSPFLIRDVAAARFDLLRIANQIGEGQLGTFDRPSAWFYLRTLGRDLGWLAPPLLAGAILLALRRGWRDASWGVWLALLAFAAPVAASRVEFERYLIAVEPTAAALAALAALSLPDLAPGSVRARDLARAALTLGLVLPGAVVGFRAAALGADTTQGQARRWAEGNVGEGEIVVQEAHGPALLDRWAVRRVVESEAFGAADSTWRLRYLQRPVLRSLTLPLLVAGRAAVVAPAPGGGNREIRLFPSSADLNRVFYEPALFQGVDWVVTSSAVRSRYEADPVRFRAQTDFYRLLEELADTVVAFRSGGSVTGPEIRAHRLGGRARMILRARFGPLDSTWWARDVPERARAELAAAMEAIGTPVSGPGQPPSWLQGLRHMFQNQIESFAYPLALELVELGRCEPAERLAEAILWMHPEQIQATGIVVTCAESRGDLAKARDAIARLLAARDPQGIALPDIRLEYERLLAQTGGLSAASRGPARAGEAAGAARAPRRRAGSDSIVPAPARPESAAAGTTMRAPAAPDSP